MKTKQKQLKKFRRSRRKTARRGGATVNTAGVANAGVNKSAGVASENTAGVNKSTGVANAGAYTANAGVNKSANANKSANNGTRSLNKKNKQSLFSRMSKPFTSTSNLPQLISDAKVIISGATEMKEGGNR